jgi:succinoglycan biosynthesis transport protein ExoP
MSFSQFLTVLRARWKLAAIVFASVVGLTVIVSLILPNKYKASASLVIDSRSPDPINGVTMQGGMLPGYISTQIDIIQSERVTQKVIRTLKLDANAQLQEQWRDDTNGEGVFETWLSEALRKTLEVTPTKDSSVIDIEYKAADARFAAAMANAYVQAYIDTTLELRVEPAKRYSSLFDAQAKQARERLEKAQTHLSAYQKEKGIVATDERLDIESARLADLSNQLVGLQSLSAQSMGRKAQAGANISEVLNNPVIGGLKADMSRQEAKLKELTARYGNAHPQVQELIANINEMRARIEAETARVTSSVSIDNTVNLSREAQIRMALEAQRERLLKLKAQRDEAAVLVRDVENAQRSYDALVTRFDQTSLESQSTQTNVSVLKQATPPAKPSSPKVLLNIIASVFLGGLLAAGVVVGRELMRPMLRNEDDVIELLHSHLLGVMPLATDAKRGDLAPIGGASPRLARKKSAPRLHAPKNSQT